MLHAMEVFEERYRDFILATGKKFIESLYGTKRSALAPSIRDEEPTNGLSSPTTQLTGK
jgi:hypothetical protein